MCHACISLKSASALFHGKKYSTWSLYIDDIITYDSPKEEHASRLCKVPKIAEKNNVKFNLEKY